MITPDVKDFLQELNGNMHTDRVGSLMMDGVCQEWKRQKEMQADLEEWHAEEKRKAEEAQQPYYMEACFRKVPENELRDFLHGLNKDLKSDELVLNVKQENET